MADVGIGPGADAARGGSRPVPVVPLQLMMMMMYGVHQRDVEDRGHDVDKVCDVIQRED